MSIILLTISCALGDDNGHSLLCVDYGQWRRCTLWCRKTRLLATV